VEEEREPKTLRRLIAALPYLIPVGILLVLVIAIALVAIGAYSRGWEWTGFQGKTLWNWMQLLLVPIILALGGLFFTQMERLNSARAQELTQQQIGQTQERLNIDAEQARLNQELDRYGQATQRFMQAIDRFGSDILEVRMGGIYSLERTAREDPNYHWPIMEVLSTYVQKHAPRKPAEESGEEHPPYPDIQAILTVIGRRSLYHRDVEYGIIDLSNTDLRKAYLWNAYLQEAHLQGADLRGANLEGADLRASSGLTDKQLEHTVGDQDTQLPDHLKRPASWSKKPVDQADGG
jgi:hypothetical protein